MSTIHVVSHTHWDREWYLTFQQFRFRLVELIDQLLALLDADPDYRYFMLDGQAIVLEDYLEIHPERETQIRRYVQEGRLVIGPWYILPDEFLVSPEATVRNLLTGERVCRRFGPRMSIGYVPDPFGHIGQMPQILRGFGIDVACLWRGAGDEPTEVRWQAPDGSEVLLLHLRDSYSNGAWLPDDEDGFVQGLAEARESLAPHATTSHVLVMQGMDHMRPRADLPRLLAVADARLEDTRVVHSTLPKYLSAVRDELGECESRLPSVGGELRSPERAHLLPGVLSTRMWIKQRNHACETLLERWAEPFSAIAAHLQPRAPDLKRFVDRAWKYLLENHPHDSICGCSVDQVHREMVTRFDWCEQIGQEVTQRALQAIARQIARSTPAIVVFNPASAPRTDLVSVEIEHSLEPGQPLLGEAGRPVATRTLGRRSRQFFATEMDREGFALLVAQFESSGGRIEGQFTFRRAEVTVEGDTAHVHLFVTRREGAEPGPVDEALAQAQALLADGSIQHYRVHGLEEKVNIRFVARDVPPLGYVTYTLGTANRKQDAGCRKQEAGSRRQEAGGKRQEAGGKRQEAGGRKQEARGKRQEARGKRQEARGKRQEASRMSTSASRPTPTVGHLPSPTRARAGSFEAAIASSTGAIGGTNTTTASPSTTAWWTVPPRRPPSSCWQPTRSGRRSRSPRAIRCPPPWPQATGPAAATRRPRCTPSPASRSPPGCAAWTFGRRSRTMLATIACASISPPA